MRPCVGIRDRSKKQAAADTDLVPHSGQTEFDSTGSPLLHLIPSRSTSRSSSSPWPTFPQFITPLNLIGNFSCNACTASLYPLACLLWQTRVASSCLVATKLFHPTQSALLLDLDLSVQPQVDKLIFSSFAFIYIKIPIFANNFSKF